MWKTEWLERIWAWGVFNSTLITKRTLLRFRRWSHSTLITAWSHWFDGSQGSSPLIHQASPFGFASWEFRYIFWAEPTFWSIGEALGEVKDDPESVDSDNGRVRVTLDGFQPLVFETRIEFYSGEEVPITLRYERLFGYCSRCHSLCHEVRDCGLTDGKVVIDDGPSHEPHDGAENFSYKGALAKDFGRDEQGEREYREDKQRGKRPLSEYRPGSDKNGRSHDVREHRYHAGTRPTGEGGRRQRGRGQIQGQVTNISKREEISDTKEDGKCLDEDKEEGQCSEIIRPVISESRELPRDEIVAPGTKVRKALFQLENVEERLGQQELVDHHGLDKVVELVMDINATVVEDSVMEDAKTDLELADMMGTEDV